MEIIQKMLILLEGVWPHFYKVAIMVLLKLSRMLSAIDATLGIYVATLNMKM